MKKTTLITLTFICWIAVGVVCVQPIKAQYQNDIIINADGSISPSTAPIQRVGNTYTMTGSVIGSITLERNNAILDGKVYTLLGELSLVEVSNVTVKNFVITNTAAQLQSTTVGISLTNTSNAIVANNTITGIASVLAWNWGPYAGIYVAGGNSNTITQNTLVDNLDGMDFINTSNNLIIQNNITGNLDFELYSTGICFVNASNNAVYHNNFVNSTYQAQSTNSVNVWDNGYPNGGNYWSDYLTKYPSAAQIGNSGIGNMPYIIDAQNKDRYPLMEPFNSTFYALETTPPKISLLSPLNQIYNESSVSLVFSVDKVVNWTGYSLDGSQNVTLTGNGTVANMTNGLHSITVYANDTFGNVGASETISFTIAKPEPFPTATVAAASGALAVLVVAGLVVYFKKRKPATHRIIEGQSFD